MNNRTNSVTHHTTACPRPQERRECVSEAHRCERRAPRNWSDRCGPKSEEGQEQEQKGRPSFSRAVDWPLYAIRPIRGQLNVNLSVSSMQLPRVTNHTSDLESAHTTQRYRLSRYLPYREHLPVHVFEPVHVPVQNMYMARLHGRKSLQS